MDLTLFFDLVFLDGTFLCGGTAGCSALQQSSEHGVRYLAIIIIIKFACVCC